MIRDLQVFVLVGLAGASLYAQTSTFSYRAVVKPGASIGGQTFAADTVISGAALNDSGEAAFAIRSADGNPDREAIFTAHRVVAKQGDVLGGKIVMRIPADTIVAINNSGQVAFEAWYADNAEVARAGAFSGLGIFVDNHLALKTSLNDAEQPPAFTLSEDGQVSLGGASRPVNTTVEPPKTTSILDRVRIKPPRNLPITLSGHGSEPNRSLQHRPAPVEERASTPFPMNRRGEILIPVNFKEGGFLLLLGTPSAR